MHEGNYQQLYYTFLDLVAVRNRLYVPPFSKIALSHICWILFNNQEHILIDNVIFLTACLYIFLLLRWSRTNSNISGFFHYCSNINIRRLTDVILSTILYILNKKSKNNPAWNRLKLKAIFFYIYPRSSQTEFCNKLIDSDLLMLWKIKQ